MSLGRARLPAVSPGGPTMTLEMETATYRKHRRELVANHAGEFVLIRGREIIGTYRTRRAALEAGYARFGYVDLFTKQVARHEAPVSVATRVATPIARKHHPA